MRAGGKDIQTDEWMDGRNFFPFFRTLSPVAQKVAGSGPNKGQSPVEWDEFYLSFHPSAHRSIYAFFFQGV